MVITILNDIDYKTGSIIGSGAFGKVYQAYENGNKKQIYALKVIRCATNKQLDQVLMEINQLGSSEHERIVPLLSVKVFHDQPNQADFHLLMEYCSGGNLNERLDRGSSSSCNRSWMSEIISAVEYLHGRNITHRDIKPQNILMTEDDHIKLCDMGLAEHFAHRSESQTWKQYYLGLGYGAACYVAPEVMREPIHYNYRVDIFATGIVFFAIMERTFLTREDETCYCVYVTSKGRRQPLGLYLLDNPDVTPELNFSGKNSSMREIVKRMLLNDYHKRPGIREIRAEIERSRRRNIGASILNLSRRRPRCSLM